MAAALEQIFELRCDFAQPRSSRVADHFRFSLKIRRDFHAGRFAEADDVAEVFADFVRVDVHGGDELHPRLGEEQPRDLRSDGSDSVLRDIDGLYRVHSGAVYLEARSAEGSGGALAQA